MEYCSKCNRSEEEVRLFNGVYVNEVVKICQKCSLREGIPLIRPPTVEQLKTSEKNVEVTKRLRIMAGLGNEKKEKSAYEELKELESMPDLEKPELIDETPIRLVENFHWIIQHSRRLKKLTTNQLANTLGESEIAIKFLEAKKLPENVIPLLKKLEQFFNVRLIRAGPEEKIKKELGAIESAEKAREEARLRRDLEKSGAGAEMPSSIRAERQRLSPSSLSFRRDKTGEVTISDLKEMQKRVDEDFPKKTWQEVGKEQMENFGKSDAPNLGQRDRTSAREFSHSSSAAASGGKSESKVPTIHELLDRKMEKDKDRILGSDIEIDE